MGTCLALIVLLLFGYYKKLTEYNNNSAAARKNLVQLMKATLSCLWSNKKINANENQYEYTPNEISDQNTIGLKEGT